MSNLQKINIYVGSVGSAYVDKETARKRVAAAQQNVQDVQTIIAKANDLYTKLDQAETTARDAKAGASNVSSLLISKISEYQSIDIAKYRKLLAIKENLQANDTDGVYTNGGNVLTADNNINLIAKQKINVGKIIEQAEILLEDDQKLVLVRIQEFNNAVESFNGLLPEDDINFDESYDLKEDELNNMINEVNESINDINETSEAINNTTQETSDLINEVINGGSSIEPIIGDDTLYWFASQIKPTVNYFASADFIITDSKNNTWHIFTPVEENNYNFFYAGIDSISTNPIWWVIVPKGYTPIKADKETRDPRFTFVMDVVVDTKTYQLFKVDNSIPSSDNTSIYTSRLNIIMTSNEEIQDPVSNYVYWYIGTTLPSLPYNPEQNIAADDVSLGWRRIIGGLASHGVNNPISTLNIEIAETLETVDYYVIIPQGCKIKDAFGDLQYSIYDSIVINNIAYDVIKSNGLDFAYTIYYAGGSSEPVGPTGETEPVGPTGETEPVTPTTYYWYVGITKPTTETVIEDDLTQDSTSAGWHLIPGALSSYNENNPIFPESGEAILINENYDDVDHYIALPQGIGIHSVLGNPPYDADGSVTLGGVTYNIFASTIPNSEFAYKIY